MGCWGINHACSFNIVNGYIIVKCSEVKLWNLARESIDVLVSLWLWNTSESLKFICSNIEVLLWASSSLESGWINGMPGEKGDDTIGRGWIQTWCGREWYFLSHTANIVIIYIILEGGAGGHGKIMYVFL